MSRIRSIKPEFWTSAQVMECSPIARLFFIGLWNFCDDHGHHPVSEKQLKALIFPGDEIAFADIRRMVDELSTNGLIETYVVDGKEFLSVTGWRHQKIDKPQAARFPYPDGSTPKTPKDNSSNGIEHSANGIDGKDHREDHREDHRSDKIFTSSRNEASSEKEREEISKISKEVREAYPGKQAIGQPKLMELIGSLPGPDIQTLAAAAKSYAIAFRAKPTTHPVALDRFISERIFEVYAPNSDAGGHRILVDRESEAGRAWEAYSRKKAGKPPPWVDGRWYFPTMFPPFQETAK